MDNRRSWLWKRKSSDKSPGESDSSSSAASHSERCSDDQDVKPMSINSSPSHSHSPEVSSRITDDESQETEIAKSLNDKLMFATGSNGSSLQYGQLPEPEACQSLQPEACLSLKPEVCLSPQPEACLSLKMEACQSPQKDVSPNAGVDNIQDSVKILNEKLSDALLTISAKEDLVKQHTKVAEEAVAGWEQAEAEVASLKRLLETTSQKNASLEDQVSHLDDALKECVRQLRQAREEQEEKIYDVVAKKCKELESEKSDLQNRIADLSKQLEDAKLELASMHVHHDLQEKIHIVEKENKDLKIELLTLSKELKILARERELSNQAAETASKLHLESVKKIARVEAECLRLRHQTRRTSLASDSKPINNNTCMESLTDSQSDSGERMLAVDDDMKNSDSWASALMAELDQFKNGNSGTRNVVNNPIEIDLMDDFLEMEKLAALPEVDCVNSSFGAETDSDRGVSRDESSKVETESLQRQVTDLRTKVEKIEGEKKELEMALAETRDQIGTTCDALMVANRKLVDLQMQLDLANESKQDALGQAEQLDSERKDLTSQLELKHVQVEELKAMVALLEQSINKELELQFESISAEAADLRKTVASLEEKIDVERSLSMQHKANAQMAEAAKESLDTQLRSANKEIGKLRGIMEILESEVRKEKGSREELMKQIEAMKTESERTHSVASHKELLEAQLQALNSEVAKLHETVNALECDAAKEKAYSSDLQMKLEAVEGIRKVLESELESSHQETMKLREKALSLETRLKDQTSLLVEYTAKSEDAVSRRKAMEGQLEAANLELTKLRNKVSLLQGKVEQEKLLSEEYEAKCRKLEAQLSRDSREAKLWRLANSNGDLKVKQEKELSSAAGKLAECQKTIANLGRQLKSLTDIDDVSSEPEKLEPKKNGDNGLISADLTDGLYELDLPKKNGSSSPPSELSVFSGGLTSLSSYLSKTRK